MFFGATDIWVHMEDHNVISLASVSKQRPTAIAYDCEATGGINIVKAAGGVKPSSTLSSLIFGVIRRRATAR